MTIAYIDPDRLAALWVKAQELGTFGARQLAVDARADLGRVQATINAWMTAGLVEDTGARVLKRPRYRVVETGHAGASLDPQNNMWRAARLLGEFSPVSLAMHAATDLVAISEWQAIIYCRVLLRGGYVRVVQKAIPGKRSAVYRVIRNPGPFHPREHRVKAVWDPNTRAFAHVAEPAR